MTDDRVNHIFVSPVPSQFAPPRNCAFFFKSLYGKTTKLAFDKLITIKNRLSIIDAIGKLRTIYPNILHLEKTGLVKATNTKQLTKDQLKRSELELLEDFYHKTLDEKLSLPQREILETLISELHAQGDSL